MKNKKQRNRLKKTLGQHLLVKKLYLDRIISAAKLDHKSRVLEIGAGPGNLTSKLCENSGQVIAVELDKKFIPELEELKINCENLQVIHADILDLDLLQLLPLPPDWKVVANPPYQIMTEIILKLLKTGKSRFTDLFLTVQKEVGERLCAEKGNKKYGAITIYTYYNTIPEMMFKIPGTAFKPVPKVDSCLVHLKIRKEHPFPIESDRFFRFVQNCFSQRRKNLVNAVKHAWREISPGDLRKYLPEWGFDPKKRPENLSPEEFEKLFRFLSETRR
ncbi:MAG: ribosomal RNA small subunit methyltransferase A [Candidatus Eremiobacteraeota bacterium]|nr:ribosomal RNA small subunit methyltransferase A [Candidatus Eremiobacteraeota bacterium]